MTFDSHCPDLGTPVLATLQAEINTYTKLQRASRLNVARWLNLRYFDCG